MLGSGDSLNISLSNNPAFSGGHFVRIEPLLVICLSVAYNLQSLTLLFFAIFFSRLIDIARHILGSL